MNKETIRLLTLSSQVNVLEGSIDDVVKTEDGRYEAKKASAVIFVSKQLANGVPTPDALRSAQEIFEQTSRNKIAETLQSARDLL